MAGPIVSPLDVRAAEDNRDSLAKMVYARMFDWLVEKINTAIGQDPDALALVGVLDIYGEPSSFCTRYSRSTALAYLLHHEFVQAHNTIKRRLILFCVYLSS